MFELPKELPAVMGVLNVTPDSFSDGGLHFDLDAAVVFGNQMFAEGAHIIDVGGESSRPGAESVSEREELRRVVPVIERLATAGIPCSVDTVKPLVARESMAAGALVINDIGGFRDAEMISVAAETGATVCAMHMQGEPRTMQLNPTYDDVVAEVLEFLVGQARLLIANGVTKERIWLDPGIGFGKTVVHNLALVRGIPTLAGTGFAVLIGVSRKSFLGKISKIEPASQRLAPSLAAAWEAARLGASILRVHDVSETVQGLKTLAAIGSSP